MKRNSLVGLTVFFSFCLIIFSCRKEIDYYIHDRNGVPSTLLESAKIWHVQNLDIQNPTTYLKPHWKDAWVTNDLDNNLLVIVPTTENYINNKAISVRRFFIFQSAGNEISEGNIVEFIGHNYDIENHYDKLIEHLNSDIISGFNGSIIFYNVNYSGVRNSTYVNGQKVQGRSEIISMRGGSTQVKAILDFTKENRPNVNLISSVDHHGAANKYIASNDDCPIVVPSVVGMPGNLAPDCLVTLHHVVITDSEGCVVSNTYTYVSHRCPGVVTPDVSGSGSGGDGGPPYGSMHYTMSEMLFIINSLEDPITGDGIEFFLLAQLKGSKLFLLTEFSTSGSDIDVGSYTLKPHYDEDGQLVFYAATRLKASGGTVNGIEFIIRENQLAHFQARINYYTKAADLFYMNGTPNIGMLQYMKGDYLTGLLNMWGGAIRSAEYWTYLISAHISFPTKTTVANSIDNALGQSFTPKLTPLGLGSTGRTTANNVKEQLIMREIMAAPDKGTIIISSVNDPRWQGWSKRSWSNSGVTINYVTKQEGGNIIAVDDFKFKHP